jgi:hypothetical protein
MTRYKPYSIVSPPYDVTSGGIRVLYALRSWLEIKGQIVDMNVRYDIPFVGVYPETYWGNDLKADTVVRYLLNKPGVMANYGIPGPTEYDPTDEIYAFSRIYAPKGLKKERILFLPVINLHIFKDLQKKRAKTCYLVGKGRNLNLHPADSIELTREFATDQKALAVLLNECQYLYGYDPLSAMYDIARLCGCKVRYRGNMSRKLLEQYEPGLDGVDFGEGTTLDPIEFRQHYEGMRELFSKRIDDFIERTQ